MSDESDSDILERIVLGIQNLFLPKSLRDKIQNPLEVKAIEEVRKLTEGLEGRALNATVIGLHNIAVFSTDALDHFLKEPYQQANNGYDFGRPITEEQMRALRKIARPFVAALEQPWGDTEYTQMYAVLKKFEESNPRAPHSVKEAIRGAYFNRELSLYPSCNGILYTGSLESMSERQVKHIFGRIPHLHIRLGYLPVTLNLPNYGEPQPRQ